MCRSMADIQSTAAEIRRGKKKKKKKARRKKLQGKNIMAPLLHRAAIIIPMHVMIREIIPVRQQRVRRCPLKSVTVAGIFISNVKMSAAPT